LSRPHVGDQQFEAIAGPWAKTGRFPLKSPETRPPTRQSTTCASGHGDVTVRVLVRHLTHWEQP
jgi:hypothetical protein